MQTVDLIVHASWIIPVNQARDVLADHALVVDQGKVVATLPSKEANLAYQAKEELDLAGRALIPGLINTHGHAAMTLFRGMADDLPLMTWLNDHIWPAEGKWVSSEFVHDGTQIAIAEMLRSGTTTYSDNYFFPEDAIRAILPTKMRAQLNFAVLDFPNNWASGPDDALAKGTELVKSYREHDQVRVIYGPHAPYTVSDEPLLKIKALAEEHGVGIQMHVHETQGEVDDAVKANGERPVARLHRLGLLGPHFQAVHMTALNDDDIRMCAETGTHIIHNPESNLKLASGFCPVDALQKSGVNVALGTDGAASNNDLDMLGEMRTAAQLAKAVAMNAEALPAYEALAVATINGAKAMNRHHELGSLEAGKLADFAAIDLSDIESAPIYDPVSHIVYATSRQQVEHVWIGGEQVVKHRELLTIDRQEMIAKASTWRSKIKE
ncbi:TRZ/ATZ family hydrolase [Salinibius halmophilus]|uniref:TRZ/ATZ family hydrolase n=1 Tax=Salinibius halmophilus TaxID=1853216 RepID=UPI000E661A2D|nr:TRZ/ATZ family hydrolase [Salinibius halmophilus]